MAMSAITKVVCVLKARDQNPLIGHLGVMWYEYLVEKYPLVNLVETIADGGGQIVSALEWIGIINKGYYKCQYSWIYRQDYWLSRCIACKCGRNGSSSRNSGHL